jgi:F-box/leucine-rich repeat protein 2/20
MSDTASDESNRWVGIKCKNLKHIGLNAKSNYITDGVLDLVALTGATLESIDGYIRAGALSGMVLAQQVARWCPNLRSFHAHTYWLNAAAVVGLLVACPNLTDLNLGSYSTMNDADLQAIAAAAGGRLQSLSISSQDTITGNGLSVILSTSPKLHTLIVEMVPGLTGSLFYTLAAHCPLLHTLFIDDGSNFSDADIQALASGCRQIRNFALNYSGITRKGLKALLLSCPQLRLLNINESRFMTGGGVGLIPDYARHIEELHVDECRLHIGGLLHIAENCRKLRYLEVNKKVLDRAEESGIDVSRFFRKSVTVEDAGYGLRDEDGEYYSDLDDFGDSL